MPNAPAQDPNNKSLSTIPESINFRIIINSLLGNRLAESVETAVNLANGLTEWIAVTRKILSNLSEDEANAIANQTAQSIYRVNI